MAGFQERLNESVQLRLSLALSALILVVATLAGVFSFALAYEEAHELQDDILRQMAALVDRQRATIDGTDAGDVDEEARIIVQSLGTADNPPSSATTTRALALPPTLPDGLQTAQVQGKRYRVLVKSLKQGGRVALAQEEDFRDEIARDSALRTLLPFLILVPVLLVIVADLVRKMFRPIAQLSHEVDQRAGEELHPVATERFPAEVRPFGVAINRLLERVARAMADQQRFIADAAHELRSPLTALSLQAERLDEATLPPMARERVQALRQGIERERHLLEQLLSLARAQAAPAAPRTTVSVQQIYRQVLEALLPVAEAKHIDIGIEGELDVRVVASEFDLHTVVRNLVENAIRYTPEAGRVDLTVSAAKGWAHLQIRDSGPGIPLSERERVFDPFYRIPGSQPGGSGLGLAIVKTLVGRLGGSVELEAADPSLQRGLSVTVKLPLAI